MYSFGKYSVKKNRVSSYLFIQEKNRVSYTLKKSLVVATILTRFKVIFLHFDLCTVTGTYNYIELNNHYYPRNHPAATLYLIEAENRPITRSCGQ
jgi:hypothetical protein